MTLPSTEMDVLDYGCGTGLVSLFLLPHVRSVAGADSSLGMLEVLRRKLTEAGIQNMSAIALDLEHDPVPPQRYHMVVTSMTLHHIADTETVLRGFRELLLPRGVLCIADLDTEPGVFHTPEAAVSVHHHGFDRKELKQRLAQIGFQRVQDVTAHRMRKAVAGGDEREFPASS